MKALLALSLLLTTTLMASVEIRSTVENTHCVIKGNQVIKTTTMKGLKFTTSHKVEFEGLEEIVGKVIESSTGTETPFKHELIVGGSKYTLNPRDSMDSMVLVGAISKICKF